MKKNKEMKKVTKQLFKKMGYIKKKAKVSEKINSPILLLLRSTGKIDIFENVAEGQYDFRKSDGKAAKILLSRSKLSYLDDESEYPVQCWVADENEATSYPIDTRMSSVMLNDIIERVQLNVKSVADWGKMLSSGDTLMKIGFVIVGGGFLIWWFTAGGGAGVLGRLI